MRIFMPLILMLIVCASIPASAQQRAALVDGHCYLENASDHSGTTVVFEASSPTAVTDSTTTDESGFHSTSLTEGIYVVRFHHDGYLEHELPEGQVLGTGSHTLPDVTLGVAGDFIVSGGVSGTWPAGLIYDVVGDIFVAEPDTLIIEPGVLVRFFGDYSLEVSGFLFAVGAEGDSIRFTSGAESPAPGDWRHVKFRQVSQEGALHRGEIYCCVFEYGGEDAVNGHQGLLELLGSGEPWLDISVEHSVFRHSSTNGIGISGAGGVISNNIIEENDWRGMVVYPTGAPTVTENIIRNNGSNGISLAFPSSNGGVFLISGNVIEGNGIQGISCGGASPSIVDNTIAENNEGIRISNGSPTVERNVIVNNDAHGINCDSEGEPVIWNNVISGNAQYGIFTGSFSETTPDIRMNIVTLNRWGIGLSMEPTQLAYNDVWNNTDSDYNGDGLPAGVGELLTVNANGDPSDFYFNISLAPEFVAPDDYHLQATSPCIDAGPESIQDPDGTRADIGAYYFNQTSSVIPHLGTVSPLNLHAAIPNPFNPQTMISFDLPGELAVGLRIYDVSGRLVDVLMDDRIAQQGRNEVVWRGRDMSGRQLPSGTYFYRLEAGGYVETESMTLLK